MVKRGESGEVDGGGDLPRLTRIVLCLLLLLDEKTSEPRSKGHQN
jgi:hypothetical protein